MKKNKLPFIKWYSSDFLAGVRGLSATQIGVYTILINEMYERCEPLPINHKRLAWQCNCTKQTFVKALEVLMEEGKIIIKNECLWNNRVQKEFENRKKRSVAGKENINTRWEKDNKINGHSLPSSYQDDTKRILSQKPEARSQKPIKEDTKVSPKKFGAQEVVNLWNRECPSLGKVIKITSTRMKKINKRTKEDFGELEDWEKYFGVFETSNFLAGRAGNWKATFDWSLEPRNMVKVIEGNYGNDSNGFDVTEYARRKRENENT